MQVSPHHWRSSSQYKPSFWNATEQTDLLLFELILDLLSKDLMGFRQEPRVQVLSTSSSKYEAPGWDQIYDMLLLLAKRIKSANYHPEVIVGVSRGGWPPARILSDLLENSQIANMKVEFYKGIGVRSKKPRITQPVTAEVSGKRILVVDDVSDTGKSLQVVSNHLKRKGVRELKVCTIYMKPKSIFTPDFYAKTTRKWIIFPWERLEAVRLISRKFRGPDSNRSSVIRELKGSGISSNLVKKLWSIFSIDGRD